MEGNKIVLRSEPFSGEGGQPRRHRITWTPNPDGTVRQLWEVLENDTVVQTLFDGTYKRVKG